MTDILSDDFRNGRASRKLYPAALSALGDIDVAGLCAAWPAWFGQMPSRCAVAPGRVDRQALSIEVAP